MNSALILRESWTRTIIFRAPMAVLLACWLGLDSKAVGYIFQALLWLGYAIGMLVLFTTPILNNWVRSATQTHFIGAYQVAVVAALAINGHSGLALIFLITSICNLIYSGKFDDHGVPLSKRGRA